MILDKILSMFFCELSDLPFRQRYENMTIVTVSIHAPLVRSDADYG